MWLFMIRGKCHQCTERVGNAGKVTKVALGHSYWPIEKGDIKCIALLLPTRGFAPVLNARRDDGLGPSQDDKTALGEDVLKWSSAMILLPVA